MPRERSCARSASGPGRRSQASSWSRHRRPDPSRTEAPASSIKLMYVRRSACGVIFGSGAMPRSVRISFARIINAALGQASLGREEVKRLMTIHGVWDRRDRRLAGGRADDLASCLSAWVRRRRCGCKRIGNRHPALVARALAIEVSLIAAAATQAAATNPRPGTLALTRSSSCWRAR